MAEQQAQWRADRALSLLLGHLPELGKATNKQIAALPFNRDSGNYKGKRTTWGGRAPARSVLDMAAMVAVRYNPPIKAFYNHLLERGQTKKVALIACARKLLSCLNAMLKQPTEWQDERVTAFFTIT